MNEKELQELYKSLSVNPKFQLGTPDEFRAMMLDSQAREQFREAMNKQPGIQLGTKDEFEDYLGLKKKVSSPVSKPSSSTQAPVRTVEEKLPGLNFNWETGEIKKQVVPPDVLQETLIQSQQDTQDVTVQDVMNQPAEVPESPDVLDYAKAVPEMVNRGFYGQAIGGTLKGAGELMGQAARVIDPDVKSEQMWLYQAGEAIQEFFYEDMKNAPDEVLNSDFGQIMSGVGQVGAMILSAPKSVAQTGLNASQSALQMLKASSQPAVIGSLQMVSEEADNVRQEKQLVDALPKEQYVKLDIHVGKEEEAAKKYDLLKSEDEDDIIARMIPSALAAGTVDLIPVSGWFKRLNKISGGTFTKRFIEKTRDVAVGTVEGAAQEAFQEFVTNTTSKEVYDFTKETADGLLQSAKVGGGTQFLLEVMSAALGAKNVPNTKEIQDAKALVEETQQEVARRAELELINTTSEEQFKEAIDRRVANEELTPEEAAVAVDDFAAKKKALEATPEEHAVPDVIEAVAEKKKVEEEITALKEEVKQTDDVFNQDTKDQIAELEQKAAELSVEASEEAGVKPDEKAVKKTEENVEAAPQDEFDGKIEREKDFEVVENEDGDKVLNDNKYSFSVGDTKYEISLTNTNYSEDDGDIFDDSAEFTMSFNEAGKGGSYSLTNKKHIYKIFDAIDLAIKDIVNSFSGYDITIGFSGASSELTGTSKRSKIFTELLRRKGYEVVKAGPNFFEIKIKRDVQESETITKSEQENAQKEETTPQEPTVETGTPTMPPDLTQSQSLGDRMRGFYENSLPKMKDVTPGKAALARIGEANPQFYQSMNMQEEADAITDEIDNDGIDVVVDRAISPPQGESDLKTMARRVTSLIAIGDAIAEANRAGDTAVVDELSSKADTIEKLIGQRGTEMGQANAFIAYYSMTPEGQLAKSIRKVSKKREQLRQTTNESGEVIGNVVDKIVTDVSQELGITKEEAEAILEKVYAKTKALTQSKKNISEGKKKVEAARKELRRIVLGKLNVGISPEAIPVLVKLFQGYAQMFKGNIQKIKAAFKKDVKDLKLDFDEAWAALGDNVTEIENFNQKLSDTIIGFYNEGNLRGDLEAALKKIGLDDSQAKEIADDFQAEVGDIIKKKKKQRLSQIVRKHEKSAKKAKVIEDSLTEAIVIGGLNDDNVRKAIEEKYGIKSFTSQEIAEMNQMVNEAKGLPSNRLKKQKMIDLMDYIKAREGDSGVDIIHAFWFSAVLFEMKTWTSVVVGNLLNFWNQYVFYGLFTKGGRFAMKESAYRLFNPLSKQGIWFGLAESANFVKKGVGFKSQDKIIRSSVLERLAKQQYTTAGKAALVMGAKGARYSGRIMSAVDAVMFYAAFDFNLDRLAYKAAEAEGLKGSAARERAREIVGKKKEAREQHYKAAKKELSDYAISQGSTFEEMFTDTDVVYRVREMSLERLAAAGQDSELVQEMAEEVALQNDARGVWGLIARALSGNFQQLFDPESTPETDSKVLNKIIKGSTKFLRIYSGFMFPFMKTAANMINMTADFVPVLGSVQKLVIDNSIAAISKGDIAPTIDWKNTDQRHVFIARQVTGLILLTMWMMMFSEDDDEFMITGAGPKDSNVKGQEYERGWKPYTIKIGEKNFYYRDSPLAVLLAFIGALNDHERFKKASDEEFKVSDAFMMSLSGYLTNASFLQTFNDLTSAVQENNASKILTALSRPITGFTNSGIARMVDRWVSPELRDAKTIEDRFFGSIISNTMVLNNYILDLKVNSLGEPINPYQNEGMFSQFTGSNKYVSSAQATNPVFDVLAEKQVYFPKIGLNVKHIDGTEMDYKEARNYVLAVAKYRGFRYAGNEGLMRQMSPEELTKKIRMVDAEAKEVAKVILFQNRMRDLSPEDIEMLVRSTDSEFAKEYIKDMDFGVEGEQVEIPEELDF